MLLSPPQPIPGARLAGKEEHRGSERASDRAGPGVAPGALSALLDELARAPEVGPEDARTSPPGPGTVIGRFELVREIGRGGFGVLYEARDQELRRLVAFKLVRPGRLEIGEEQLRREADVIAQLSHPNLVTLFDVGRCEHGAYLVLELLRGGTLEERLRQGPIPPAEAVRLATEVARGLGHAHARGVVHRDLKPSNVFLCQDGQVKLLDFGMSHAFGRRRMEGGTPAYMAPEQWRGAPEDERTDVFALGVMLFRMLSGELPFPADARGRAVLSRGRAPALEVPGQPELGKLVGRMLEKDPTKRPRDGGEVLAALSKLQGGLERSTGTAPGPVPKIRSSPRRALALLAAAVVLGAAALVALTMRPAPPRLRSIAVLPFANMSDSADNEYLSDGLTEEIRHSLTRLPELRVAAGAASSHFKNRTVDVAEAARRLRVDVVLDGSVRRDRDHLRIAAELFDARSGFRVWSQIYDRELRDVFAIQDDIARRVVGTLEVVLSRASESELRGSSTANIEAYDLYLRGRAYLRLPSSQRNLEQATALFERAIAADGQFAKAYAGLCDAWLARYELDRASQSFEKAESACHRALTRDREAGEVYAALGNLHLSSGQAEQAEREFRHATTLRYSPVDALLGLARAYDAQRQLDLAERAFREAKRLDPGYWRPYQLLGNLLFRSGRYAEAARDYGEVIALTPDHAAAHSNLGAAYYLSGDFEKAAGAWRASLELAPTTVAYSNTGTSYFYLGRFEDAAAMYRKALELAPANYEMWGNLGDAYAHAAGREADAAAAYRKAVALGEERLRINQADADTMSHLAHCLASLGLAERARQLNEEALRRDPKNMYIRYNAALVNVRLGARDAALGELERAVALGYQRQLLPSDPGLAPLRHEKRFAALLPPRKD